MKVKVITLLINLLIFCQGITLVLVFSKFCSDVALYDEYMIMNKGDSFLPWIFIFAIISLVISCLLLNKIKKLANN